jgi:hypothetical protein
LPGAPRYLAYDRSFSAARHRGKINIKVTPRAAGAIGMVAAGDADIAVMPVSEILRAPGVDFAGTIPPEIQLDPIERGDNAEVAGIVA